MIAVLLVSALSINAQDYNWAVGVRGGGANAGITVKNNMGVNAIEFGIDFGWTKNGRLQALYEWQTPVANGLNFYYGLGAYIGAFDYTERAKIGLGAEGVVGLEYKIPGVPIAFSLDYRPSVSVLAEIGFGYSDIGFGVKFCF